VKKSSSHITFERLVDLVEGRMPANDQSLILAHLTDCPQCTAEKAWLERLINLMRTDTTESTPPALIDRIVKLFESHRHQAKADPKQRQRIFALLRFDNVLPPLSFGLRSGQAETQQRLYSVGSYDLDLRLKPVGEEWMVSGQLLGTTTGGKVELYGEVAQVQATLNELSEFTLPAVPAGPYTLVLDLDEIEIEITDLELS
jgi:hypothetical protein